MKKITPCLWFGVEAEEAVNFYTSVFKDSQVEKTTWYGKAGPMPEGTVLTIAFRLNGQEFLALNGGPEYRFNPSVSFVVDCKTQEEVDYYWHSLTEGGEEVECGWLTDKYGLSWQIVPVILDELLEDKNKEKAERVMEALLKMKKIVIQDLLDAYQAG